MPDLGNVWRKYRGVPRAYPLLPPICAYFHRVGNKERFGLPGAGGGSFPLYGGPFARSYSVSILVPFLFLKLGSSCMEDFFDSFRRNIIRILLS